MSRGPRTQEPALIPEMETVENAGDHVPVGEPPDLFLQNGHPGKRGVSLVKRIERWRERKSMSFFFLP